MTLKYLTSGLTAIFIMVLPGPGTAQDQLPDPAVPGSRTEISLSFAPVVKEVAPAVVNIYTRRVVQIRRSPLFDDPFFRRFFGNNQNPGMPRERVQGSLGSGVIVHSSGIIVTNNHVIGQADSITIALADRREFEAEVLLADERTDLAILKIDAGDDPLPVLAFADSDDVEVGDLVLAVGNPFGVGQTVTSGIISATARTQVGISDYRFFIQTDAAVNPGNSGGALVGMDGRLIGINSAIYSRSGGNNGIGFAIPANMVKTVLDAALAEGVIILPWLGADGQAVDSNLAASLGFDRPGGVLIDQVFPNSPADEAGLQAGDVIMDVNGREVIDPQGLRFRVATANGENDVAMTVVRDDEKLTLFVRLAPPPEEPLRNLIRLEGRQPFQGVEVGNLSPLFAEEIGINPFEKGVIVLNVDRRSPAGRRQFVRAGDIILQLNDERIENSAQLAALLEVPHEDYLYRLKRGNRVIECGIIALRSFYCR